MVRTANTKRCFKAIRYTEDDEQKKHPMPFLHVESLPLHPQKRRRRFARGHEVKLKALKNALVREQVCQERPRKNSL